MPGPTDMSRSTTNSRPSGHVMRSGVMFPARSNSASTLRNIRLLIVEKCLPGYTVVFADGYGQPEVDIPDSKFDLSIIYPTDTD